MQVSYTRNPAPMALSALRCPEIFPNVVPARRAFEDTFGKEVMARAGYGAVMA